MSGEGFGTIYDAYRFSVVGIAIPDSINRGSLSDVRGLLLQSTNVKSFLFGLRSWDQGRPMGVRRLPSKFESLSTEWHRVPSESSPHPRVQHYWDPLPTDSRYQFINPLLKLYVDLDKASDSYVVSDEFSSVYGTGATLAAARRSYIRDLLDYVAKLEEREDYLAKGLRQELAELRRHIARRP